MVHAGPALPGSPGTGEEDFPPPGRQTGSRGTKGDRGRPHGGPLALLAPPYPTVPCPAPPCCGVSGGPRCEPDVRAGWVEGGPRPWNPLQNNASTRPSPRSATLHCRGPLSPWRTNFLAGWGSCEHSRDSVLSDCWDFSVCKEQAPQPSARPWSGSRGSWDLGSGLSGLPPPRARAPLPPGPLGP